MSDPTWLRHATEDVASADLERLRPRVLRSAQLIKAWMDRHAVTEPEWVEVLLRQWRPGVPLGRCQTWNRGTAFTLYIAADRPDLEVEMLGHEFAHVAFLRALDTVADLPESDDERDLLLHVVSEHVAVRMMALFAPDAAEAAQHVRGCAIWWQKRLARRSAAAWRRVRADIAEHRVVRTKPLAVLLGNFAYTSGAFLAAGRPIDDLRERSRLPRYVISCLEPLLAPLLERTAGLPADPDPSDLSALADGYLAAARESLPEASTKLAAQVGARRRV